MVQEAQEASGPGNSLSALESRGNQGEAYGPKEGTTENPAGADRQINLVTQVNQQGRGRPAFAQAAPPLSTGTPLQEAPPGLHLLLTHLCGPLHLLLNWQSQVKAEPAARNLPAGAK